MSTEKPKNIRLVDHKLHPLISVYYETPEDRNTALIALSAMGTPKSEMQTQLSLDCDTGQHLSYRAVCSYRAIYNSLNVKELLNATARLFHGA